MLVNQTLLHSVFNNTNNIRFKLCKNSFNAVWKKAAQGSPLFPTYYKDAYSLKPFISSIGAAKEWWLVQLLRFSTVRQICCNTCIQFL